MERLGRWLAPKQRSVSGNAPPPRSAWFLPRSQAAVSFGECPSTTLRVVPPSLRSGQALPRSTNASRGRIGRRRAILPRVCVEEGDRPKGGGGGNDDSLFGTYRLRRVS